MPRRVSTQVVLVLSLASLCPCATSQTANITIPPRAVNVSINEVAEFNCTAVANSFAWDANGQMLTHKDGVSISTEAIDDTRNLRKSTLKILASSTDNATNISCIVIHNSPLSKNQSNPVLLLVQGLLESVSNLTVVSINSTTVLISWSPPFTLEGVPILGYNVTITNTTSGENETMSVEGDTAMLYYSIDHPDPDNNFTVTMVPINGAGPGKKATFSFKFVDSMVSMSTESSSVSRSSLSSSSIMLVSLTTVLNSTPTPTPTPTPTTTPTTTPTITPTITPTPTIPSITIKPIDTSAVRVVPTVAPFKTPGSDTPQLGHIIGGVIGGVVLVLVLGVITILVIAVVYRKRKSGTLPISSSFGRSGENSYEALPAVHYKPDGDDVKISFDLSQPRGSVETDDTCNNSNQDINLENGERPHPEDIGAESYTTEICRPKNKNVDITVTKKNASLPRSCSSSIPIQKPVERNVRELSASHPLGCDSPASAKNRILNSRRPFLKKIKRKSKTEDKRLLIGDSDDSSDVGEEEAKEPQYADLADFNSIRPKPIPQMDEVRYATISPATHERTYANVGDQKRQAKIHGVPSDDDIAKISQRVAHKWRLVGQELGVDPAELDQIASECGSDQSCCYELFRKWSAREITASCPFTWSAVIEILDSSIVRESSLARTLESTYL